MGYAIQGLTVIDDHSFDTNTRKQLVLILFFEMLAHKKRRKSRSK